MENFVSASEVPILDVRSPSEYTAGHIPRAISFPLFNDQERSKVGTIYKHQGPKAAIKVGLEITGPKMVQFIENAEKLNSSKLKLYCWRGGMRSESMAWLLERYDIGVTLLEGGYKSYRQDLISFFDQKLPLKVVTGYTGSGKTSLLRSLKSKGEQVIDLEGIANHQGSSFGNQLCEFQPTTEQFQNDLFENSRNLDLERHIWIEDESIRIGNVNLPEGLFHQINSSEHILIETEIEERVEKLVEEYGRLPNEKLIYATRSISNKLGTKKAEESVNMIKIGDLAGAARLILTYYDARYDRSINKKDSLISRRYQLGNKSIDELAETLINGAACLSN